ncbi:MAG: phytanoyl-CoA dioxygenase family protein [Proteobacteria bacterium]|nr:phytanoyl-CoA dioxygenase family protein [Pseudomonadota bacterium]
MTVPAGRSSPPEVPLVETDRLETELDRVGANAETRAFARSLRDKGYGVLDLGPDGPGLCDQAVEQTRTWFDDSSVQRVQDAWRRSPAVKALATHPRVLAALRTVYGREPFPFQTLSFQVGTEQPKHSDAIHFHSDPPLFMCGVWIALEDVALDAGALVYWPGSHKLPILTMRGAGLNRPDPEPADYDRLYQPALDARIAASGIAPEHAVVRKGQAFVWAANLVHGGSPITREGATRRSLVVHFYFEGCVYYTPMISDPEAGRLAVRLPADVRTGGWVWPRRQGRRVGVRPGFFAEAVLRRVLRRPVASRRRG